MGVNDLKIYAMYTIYVINADGRKTDKGIFQYVGIDGDDHLFKSIDWVMNKQYNILVIPREVMDRFEFKPHSYISNGLCDIPEEGD